MTDYGYGRMDIDDSNLSRKISQIARIERRTRDENIRRYGTGLAVSDNVVSSVAGPAGSVGPAGVIGPIGPIGTVGPAGPAGPKGSKGSDGDDGQRGSSGSTGSTGPAGPAGAAGSTGSTGSTGPAGPKGSKGNSGIAHLSNEIKTGLANITNTVATAIIGIAGKVADGLKLITAEAITGLGLITDKVVTGIKLITQTAAAGLEKITQTVVAGIKKITYALKDGAEQLTDTIVKGIVKITHKLVGTTQTLTNDIVDGIARITDKARDGLVRLTKDVATAIKQIKAAAFTWLNGLGTATMTKLKNITTTINGIVSTAVTKLGDLLDSGTKAVFTFANGVWATIIGSNPFAGGGGGGVTNLTGLTIDDDKDWNEKEIANIKRLSMFKRIDSFSATIGDIQNFNDEIIITAGGVNVGLYDIHQRVLELERNVRGTVTKNNVVRLLKSINYNKMRTYTLDTAFGEGLGNIGVVYDTPPLFGALTASQVVLYVRGDSFWHGIPCTLKRSASPTLQGTKFRGAVVNRRVRYILSDDTTVALDEVGDLTGRVYFHQRGGFSRTGKFGIVDNKIVRGVSVTGSTNSNTYISVSTIDLTSELINTVPTISHGTQLTTTAIDGTIGAVEGSIGFDESTRLFFIKLGGHWYAFTIN